MFSLDPSAFLCLTVYLCPAFLVQPVWHTHDGKSSCLLCLWHVSFENTSRRRFNADLTRAGGAAVRLPDVPLLVHSSILHTPHLSVSVSVQIVFLPISTAAAAAASAAADDYAAAAAVAAAATAAADYAATAAATAQLNQRYPDFLVFLGLTTKNIKKYTIYKYIYI